MCIRLKKNQTYFFEQGGLLIGLIWISSNETYAFVSIQAIEKMDKAEEIYMNFAEVKTIDNVRFYIKDIESTSVAFKFL